ncbi:MAG: calcium/sodium antiporter, partial [Clostridia bacterium]|nr:calcium/sodium antiporter [Clostridia bacterium]
MLIPVVLFIVGLILLIKGGDWFVEGATGIAHRFHVPELLIGATVVSIGTTLPEVMVSATSALGGHGEIAYGNALGSIICNTALIAALTIAIRPSETDRKTLKTPVIFFFIAAAIYTVVAYTTGRFSRGVGILLLAVFVIYVIINVRQVKSLPQSQTSPEPEAESNNSTVKDVLLLVIGAVLIAVGANLLVDNGTLIAQALGVPESVIALTFVALGTSLPELVTAITSLAKGHGSLSLGNVIGANLFNLVLVSGTSATLAPFDIPSNKIIAGMNASLVVDVPLMLFVMAFLTLPALKREKLSRVQGIVLLVIYAVFC